MRHVCPFLLGLLLLLLPARDAHGQWREAGPSSPVIERVDKYLPARPQAAASPGPSGARRDTLFSPRSGSFSPTIPPTPGDRLDQSGRRKLSVAGGVIGFVVGGAAGGALGCLANRDSYGVFCGGQSDTRVFLGVALGGAAGAALGALLFR